MVHKLRHVSLATDSVVK